MRVFINVIVFSAVVIFLYMTFSTTYIPSIYPSPPPKEEVLDLSSMTMEQFVALGDKVFNGKGTCTLCHNPVGGRAPLLEQAATVAKERLVDARYKGEATDVEGYLYESLIKPSAFVVIGFGKSGTNDTESPMPDVSTGAVGLNEAELRAVVAYMQDIAGMEVTVEIPEGEAPVEEGVAEAPLPAKTAKEAFDKYSCSACHKVSAEGTDTGMAPDLATIGAKRSASYLRRAILDPNAEIAEGFMPMMPDNYGDQLTAGELELLVEHMAKSK